MGGMERASVNVANGLVELGAQVTFVALFKHPHFFKLSKAIDFYEPADFNHRHLAFGKTLFWLRKIIAKEQPTISLVYNKWHGALVSFALLGTKHKIVVSERSSPLYPWPKKLAFLNKLAFSLRAPAGVMAQTSIAADYQKKYYSKKVPIKIIPNALREVRLFPEIKRKPFILAVGRFNEYIKGFDRLIEVFAKVKNQDWELVFAGGDENGEYLKKQAEALGILPRIRFLGAVKNMDEVYAQAGIFVIPSRSEGFPNALCEAMGAGLACISFDFVAGPRDIIANGEDGYLIENNALNKMAAKIDELIENEAERLRIGKNAMKIRERLDQKQICSKIFDFLQLIAKQKNA